ncbi:putative autotransporter [Rhodopseudomonas palustris TIE-1]|uniref:autotransporter outer membrane beta-barrel domain-containing protein n=1 Tax=Rhodopseudomonas palustris TaxID=1076 RepID=UPI000164A6B1|nr:autotransporter outer membrane beta-barrel domain-containing protein [Rhodopseudomonas palustris]ACF01689.1 putative autotransporter [Rhodopseudomonas palustris TIE-1]
MGFGVRYVDAANPICWQVGPAGARYDATTAQAFGEIGYRVAVGQAVAEPFGGLALVHLHRDGFTEGGGITALSASSRNDDIGYSMLGSRLTTSFTLSPGLVAMPRLAASWQHAFGATAPIADLAFRSTGERVRRDQVRGQLSWQF